MRLLIAEDEAEIAKALKIILEKNKYTVDVVHNGSGALDYILNSSYDVIVLDIMMPGIDGLTVLRKIREENITTPVMLLTAKSEIDDRVAGLDAGADDYLPKPFASSEFIAMVKALSRRNEAYAPAVLSVGSTQLDCNKYELIHGTESVRLNNKEYQLMELFMKHPRHVFSSWHLMDKVWELDAEAGIDVVWTYIGFLRKKLKMINADIEIKTVRGAGYSLEETKC